MHTIHGASIAMIKKMALFPDRVVEMKTSKDS
jgi:hypothetical protein